MCHQWPAQPVCADCIALFAQGQNRCDRCAVALPAGQPRCGRCLTTPPALERCLAAVDYAYPWSGLIADFKFHGQPGLARHLAPVMLRTPGAADALRGAELVIPVPLSARRLAERGYNQALLLARQLAGPAVAGHLLLRIQDTAPQNALGRSARLENVRQAFAVDPLQQSALQGRRILLVDDVMTTGASLHSAAQTLLRAGAAAVGALVLARTPEYTAGHVPHRPG